MIAFKKILDILVCPICKSKLQYDRNGHELICKVDKLAFPIKNDIPIMIANKARKI